MTAWRDNDRRFIDLLAAGYGQQAWVAHVLRRYGIAVDLPPLTIRESIADAWRWRDSIDLMANGRRIEVKSRRYDFTSPRDFPQNPAFIDETAKYDGRKPSDRPFAYVVVSASGPGMMAIRSESPDGWSRITREDRLRGVREFYAAPLTAWRTIDALAAALRRDP